MDTTMDTTTQHSADASVDWTGRMRDAAIGAIALAVIVASMVAWAGIERLRLGLAQGPDVAPRPRWPL